MAEVASAYVSLMFSAKGATDKISHEVGSAGAKAGADGGAKAGKGFARGFSPHLKALGGAIAGTFAVSKGIDFLKDSVGEAREAQKVGAQTTATIKATGGAANVSAKHVGDLATAISNKAGIDDEAIQTGQNLLLSFKGIKNEAGKGNDVFDQTTKAMVDMSAAMGKAPRASAIALGKALNDPVKGMTALSKVGVTFTEQQKAQNKALVQGGDANALMAMGLIGSTTEYNMAIKRNNGDVAKTVDQLTNKLAPAQKKMYEHYAEGGHTMEAQKTILKELNSEFGGSAAATATAGEKAGVAFGNLKEQVGTALLPVIDRVANALTTKVIPAVSGFISGMQSGEGAGGTFVTILTKVGSVAVSVGGFLMRHKAIIATVVAAYIAWKAISVGMAAVSAIQLIRLKAQTVGTVEHAVVSKASAAATKIWAGTQWLLNAAMDANPIGLIVVAVGLLIGAAILAYKHSDKFRAIVDALWAAIKRAGAYIGGAFVGAMHGIGKALSGAWGILKKVGGFIATVFVGYLKLLAKGWLTMGIFGVRALRLLLSVAFKVFGGILGAADKGLGWIPGIGGKIHKAKTAFDAFGRGVVGKLAGVEQKLRDVRSGIDNVKPKTVHIDIITTKTTRIVNANVAANKHSEIAGARAAGGPVLRGRTYLVGEDGPELFKPAAAGRIVPNSQVNKASLLAPGAAAGGPPRRMQLVVGDRVFDAYVRDLADNRVQARSAHAATLRRQR